MKGEIDQLMDDTEVHSNISLSQQIQRDAQLRTQLTFGKRRGLAKVARSKNYRDSDNEAGLSDITGEAKASEEFSDESLFGDDKIEDLLDKSRNFF